MHVICLMAVTETGSPSCLFCRSSDSVDGFCGVEFVAVDFFREFLSILFPFHRSLLFSISRYGADSRKIRTIERPRFLASSIVLRIL